MCAEGWLGLWGGGRVAKAENHKETKKKHRNDASITSLQE